MRKILVLASLIALASCKKAGENEFLISGKADGVENGKKVILQIQNDMGMLPKDTVKIENGKFELKGSFNEGPEIAFIMIEGVNNGMVPFILENGDIDITVDKDTIQKSKISGTNNNEKFQKYNDESSVIFKKMVAFQKANEKKFMDAGKAGDTATINSLRKQNTVFQKDMDKLSENFVDKNPEAFLSVLLLENFVARQTLEIGKTEKLFDKLSPEMKKTKSGIRVGEIIKSQSSVQMGKTAPNFSGKTPEGKTLSLKEAMGKVTIVDFWASWCGPCRAENPGVVALYNEFHAKGLNIIGVSLDEDAAKWKDAIAKDNLSWTHISNLLYWKDPIAKLYGVKAIPATFILDASGNIVAKDLHGAELKAKVAELLAK